MIIVDTALAKREAEGAPIRVGIIGAGYMGRALTLQIISAVPGMDVVGVYNRTISRAELALTQSEVDNATYASSIQDVEDAAKSGKYVYTDDPMILCEADNIDCIVEATGEVEFGAEIALRSIEYGKHVVLLNAEIDAVLGPLLKYKADQAGVCIIEDSYCPDSNCKEREQVALLAPE